jgi:hypothetical protein
MLSPVSLLYVLCPHQDDDDGHLTALQIVEDLMQKSPDTFLDHFARLGVFNMVHSLAGPPQDEDEDEEDGGEDTRINDKKVRVVLRLDLVVV